MGKSRTAATKLAELVRRTDGYTVTEQHEGYRFLNEKTQQVAVLHESVDTPPKMEYQEKRIAARIGWTRQLYKDQQAEKRRSRMAAAEARKVAFQPPMVDEEYDHHPTQTIITTPKTFGIGDVVTWQVGEMVFTISLEAINKNKAEEYLSKIGDVNPETGHKAQRPRTPSHIADMALKMQRGEFGLSPDMIVFNEYEELINGQHRLSGLMASELDDDEDLLFLVSRRWPRETFYLIDHNRPRNMADALYLRQEKNHVGLATAVRMLHLFDNVSQRVWNQTRMSDQQGLAVLEANPLLRESVRMRSRARRITCVGNALWLAHYLIRRASAQEDGGCVDLWFDRLIEGYELGRNEPVTKLRDWFTGAVGRRETESFRKVNRTWLHVYVILQQWNNTQKGVLFKDNATLSPKVPFTVPRPLAYVPPELRPKAHMDRDAGD